MFWHVIEHTKTPFGHAAIDDNTKFTLDTELVKDKLLTVSKIEHRNKRESLLAAVQ